MRAEPSDTLHAAVQAAIAADPPWDAPWDGFEPLATRLFAHQFARNAPYQAFCRRRGVTPDSLAGWDAIPVVPTEAYKDVDLATFPADEAAAVYLTSGTTQGRRGRHLLRRTDTYVASLTPGLRRFLATADRPRIVVLAAPLAEDPSSSLGAMLQWARDHEGGPGSVTCWRDGPDLAACLDALTPDRPVALLGTARALWALWDEALRRRPVRLHPGSRVMETGGFKGDAERLDRDRFYAVLGEGLGLPAERVISEYGMTELGSQGWQGTLVPALAAHGRRYLFPPWCRVRAMDPDTLAPLPDGAEGLLAFWDLANVDSVIGVQTSDLGRVVGASVALHGRAPGATPRGCSLAVDELLAAR